MQYIYMFNNPVLLLLYLHKNIGPLTAFLKVFVQKSCLNQILYFSPPPFSQKIFFLPPSDLMTYFDCRQYLANIKSVDEGVEKMVNLFEKFYDDGRTSYVFTSDHGMGDWGKTYFIVGLFCKC